MKKTVFIWVLVLCLSIASAGFASVIRDLFTWTAETEQPYSILLSAEVIRTPSYGEERTEKLNRLLRHLQIKEDIDRDRARTTVLLDGKAISDWMTEKGDMDEKTMNRSIDQYGKTWETLYSFSDWFEKLPDVFSGNSVSNKINNKYKGYGIVTRRETVTLMPEDLETYVKSNGDKISESGLYPDLNEMSFEGRQKIQIQYDENNKALRVNYNGKCAVGEGTKRNVMLDWKMLRDETLEKDQIQLRTPTGVNSERDNMLMEREWILDENGNEQLKWQIEYDQVHNRVRTQTRTTMTLETNRNGISGTIHENIISQGSTRSTDIEGKITTRNGIPSEGTLEIILKTDKIETSHLKVSFDLFQGKQIEAAEDEMTEHELAVAMIRELMSLPKEDLAFLLEGIDPEVFMKEIQK